MFTSSADAIWKGMADTDFLGIKFRGADIFFNFFIYGYFFSQQERVLWCWLAGPPLNNFFFTHAGTPPLSSIAYLPPYIFGMEKCLFWSFEMWYFFKAQINFVAFENIRNWPWLVVKGLKNAIHRDWHIWTNECTQWDQTINSQNPYAQITRNNTFFIIKLVISCQT